MAEGFSDDQFERGKCGGRDRGGPTRCGGGNGMVVHALGVVEDHGPGEGLVAGMYHYIRRTGDAGG